MHALLLIFIGAMIGRGIYQLYDLPKMLTPPKSECDCRECRKAKFRIVG